MVNQGSRQRLVVALIDGLGSDYYEKSPMTVLHGMAREGFFRPVKAVVPTVTNANNVSVCCGAWPDEHGISANSYYDRAAGRAVYMNAADLIKTDTIFQRALKQGVQGALLTSKRKPVELFHRDTLLAVAAEAPPADFSERYGAPADIYSSEINEWLWSVAVDLLKTRPEIGVIYMHTTDYPMHMWAPEEAGSLQHLAKLDGLLGQAKKAAPDAAFFITADHGMNFKRRCWDLSRACAGQGLPVLFALSPERDYYIKHHRNFAGSAWVWVKKPSDLEMVRRICLGLEGVEEVITRDEAVSRFRLPGEYIGDLMVLGDRATVFGDLETPGEDLPGTYRAHGSLYESDVPLLIYNWNGDLPEAEYFRYNLHLTRFLFR
ncbi:MAG: alkaline phosphatase family protein [Desulfobaccales bacterium]